MHQQALAARKKHSDAGNNNSSDADARSERSSTFGHGQSLSSPRLMGRDGSSLSMDGGDDGYDRYDDTSDIDDSESEQMPSSVQFTEGVHASVNSALAGVHYQMELFATSLRAMGSEMSGPTTSVPLIETFSKSSEGIQKTLRDLVRTVEHREATWTRRLEREQELKRIWEENLRALAKEHDELQTKASMQVTALEQASRSALHTVSPGGLGRRESGDGVAGAGGGTSDDEEDVFFDAVDEYREKAMTLERKPQKSAGAGGAAEAPDMIAIASAGYPANR